MILKQRAAVGCSQSAYEYSESKRNDWLRLLLAACCTELVGFMRTRFWRSICSRWTVVSTLRKFKGFGIVFLQIEANWYRHHCGTKKGVEKRAADLCNANSSLCQEVFYLESSKSCVRNSSSKFFFMENQWSQISTLHFDKFLDASDFRCWNSNFKTEVCSCSGFVVQWQCCGSKK